MVYKKDIKNLLHRSILLKSHDVNDDNRFGSLFSENTQHRWLDLLTPLPGLIRQILPRSHVEAKVVASIKYLECELIPARHKTSYDISNWGEIH